MAILTQPTNPISANQEYTFELNVAELLQLVQSLTGSSYWEDVNNWRAVDFVYINAQKQYQRIVFNLASNETEVTFKFNEDCINGLFSCGRITVFGYVNNSFRINQDEYGTQFDVIIEDGVVAGPNVDVTSLNVPLFDTYAEGSTLDFIVNFSDIVTVNGTSLLLEDGNNLLLENGNTLEIGETRLALIVGTTLKYATYLSGSSTSSITYRYTVEAGDQDLDGIEVLYIDLNGGSILDLNNQNVNITLPNVDTSGIIIDNVAPDIIAPTITDILVSDGIYEDQDDIIFIVEFSENVLVSGSPVLTLDIGGVTRQAALLSSSLNQAVFSYTVEQPDNDNNGIEILSLDNGVITDAALNPLDRTLPVVDTSNVFVSTDVTAPTILSITAVDGNYKAGDNLNFTATFSEPVVITGTPYLLVDIGGTQVQADMISSNSADATFSYTVLAGQLDLNGVQVLSLNSAVITDNALNLLDRTLPSMDMSLVKVDAVAPSITSISAPADDNYATGEVISFVANFTENVVVTGTPFLQITIGSSAKQFNYVSGSGTNALTFSYTVLSGDLDDNGISFASTNIQIPSATIRDGANNNAVLSFTAPTTTDITVNFTQITTNPISIGGDLIYSLKYNSFDNNLYLSKIDTSNPFQSPGLYLSSNDGVSYISKTPIGINEVKEVTSTGNVYSTNLSMSGSSIYQSLDSGATFNLADSVGAHSIKYYVNGDKIFGMALSTSDEIGYVWEGETIDINRISLRTSIGSPLINTSLKSLELNGDLMYIGTENGLFISNLLTDLTYFSPISFGGERYVLNTANTTLPLNNVFKVVVSGSEVYVIMADTLDLSDTAPRTLYYSDNSGASFSTVTTPTGAVQNITIGNSVYILVLDAGQRKLYKKVGASFVLVPLPQTDGYLLDSGDNKVFVANTTGSSLYIVNDE